MVRSRFAPSPTGGFHIGNLRTALYSYALAKHENGEFVLRIEDTDKKREVEGGVEMIKTTLEMFGLIWDKYYVQSERQKTGIYERAAKKLVDSGHAFYCQCEAKNAKEKGYSKVLRDPCRDKKLKSGAVKLKVPDNERVGFVDFVLGKEVSWDSSSVADATLLKSDGFPTYHLAVVVDDSDMGITHALRGHDWMPSTPIHILVYKYLGYKMPNLGHLTDILDPGGGKLSKRKGSVSVDAMLAEGYLPEAVLNFVMLLGWAPKDNREIFTLEEFVKVFDVGGLQKANPVFDRNKLDWMNGEYVRQVKSEKLKVKIYDFYKGKYGEEMIGRTVPLVKTRMKKLSDYEELAGFFFERPKVDRKMLGNNAESHLEAAAKVIEGLEDWNLEKLNEGLMKVVGENGFKTGEFFMDLRIAITGRKFTPPINESMIILGKEETTSRIRKCLPKKT